MKKVLLAWSGGKDSAWALHRLRAQPGTEVAGIFTTINENRIAVHAVREELLAEQARCARIELETIPIPRPCPNARYEEAMADFAAKAKARGITHLAFGDLFLEDIRRYRERQFAASGLELLFPIWGRPTRQLAEEMTASGLRAWIVCVDTRRAPPEWAGAVFDTQFISRVPEAVDPCGENGEFHTFVFEGPMLTRGVHARPAACVDRGGFRYCELASA